MDALHRKLWRDLVRMRGQALAIGAVIACGVATFVMSLCVLVTLQQSRDRFYRDYHFADLFARVARAPASAARRLAEIPGVGAVRTRVVKDVTLEVEGLSEPAIARLISLPPLSEASQQASQDQSPSINDGAAPLNGVALRTGRLPAPGRRGEVAVGEAFAEAHQLQPGDKVWAIMNGARTELTIVGVVISPEYVFLIRDGQLLPDLKRFGVFWMNHDELAAAFDMQGSWNDVALSLAPGGDEAEVIRQIDRRLEPFGGLGAYGRESQLSHRYVRDALLQLRATSVASPVIFLGVAVFLLNVSLSRLVSSQREQIATIKAFGYTHREIGGHYLELVLMIVLAGTAAGTLAGLALGSTVALDNYRRLYKLPTFDFQAEPWVLALASALSLAAGVLGAFRAVRSAMSLAPAVGMRPEPPASFRPTLAERLGLTRLFSTPVRMMLRSLERRPLRAGLSMLGIAMATAILVLGLFLVDTIDYVTHFQFEVVQKFDVSLVLNKPAPQAARREIANLPGVMLCEPYRAAPVVMRFQQRSRKLTIMGLPAEGQLFRLTDADERHVTLPPDGLVLSAKLADLLGVRVGDFVVLEVLEGERPRRQAQVAGLIADYSGLSAYMELQALHRCLREGDHISGAFVTLDESRFDEFYARVKELPQVGSVNVKDLTVQSFRETTAQNLLQMRVMNIIFACIIAFGVVYNTARISLAERTRELATLRVVGFSRWETSVVLLGELALITLLAAPLGLMMGRGFAQTAAAAAETETQRFPAIVDPSTYAAAAAITLLATAASALLVRRRIDRLDLVGALKTKD